MPHCTSAHIFRVVCPQNGSAVLRGLRKGYVGVQRAKLFTSSTSHVHPTRPYGVWVVLMTAAVGLRNLPPDKPTADTGMRQQSSAAVPSMATSTYCTHIREMTAAHRRPKNACLTLQTSPLLPPGSTLYSHHFNSPVRIFILYTYPVSPRPAIYARMVPYREALWYRAGVRSCSSPRFFLLY